jgi:hypothetical protein
VSKEGKEAEDHFGWFTHFAKIDCEALSDKTRESLGWKPVQQELLEDLVPGVYF